MIRAALNMVMIFVCASRRVPHTIPGKYGYGRAPFVAPLQKNPETPHLYRQRRSAAANPRQSSAGRHSTFRSIHLDASNNIRRFNRPYVHPRAQSPKNNPVWSPLYQPASRNQAEAQQELHSGHQQHKDTSYSPLPSSFCTGEHAQYRICNSNVCKSALSPYSNCIWLLSCVLTTA